MDGTGGDLPAEAFRKAKSLLDGHVPEHEDEFSFLRTPEKIVGANGAREKTGKPLRHSVPDPMAMRIVGFAEAIDIAEDDARHGLPPGRTPFTRLLLQSAPVGQAGEPVRVAGAPNSRQKPGPGEEDGDKKKSDGQKIHGRRV